MPLDLKQISLQADRTRSLFRVAAEEATSPASRTWSVRKTQLLLPRLSPSSLLVSCPNTALREFN